MKTLAAALLAVPLLAPLAHAQSCSSPPPEPKTSAIPAPEPPATQPG
jgi:hypothetical protein